MEDTDEIEAKYIMPEKVKMERERWYSQTYVLFEMIKAAKNKEIAFLMDKAVPRNERRTIRYTVAKQIDYLKQHFEAFGFFSKNYNLYHSVADLRPIPIFTYNLKQRTKTPEWIDFNKRFNEWVVGFDLFIDFDGGEKGEKTVIALDEMRQVKAMLDADKVPYYVLNSSTRGFHIKIPREYMPKYGDVEQEIAVNLDFIRKFKAIYLFDTIDPTIVDMKRIAKLPYSYVGQDGSICLPLSDMDVMHFRPENVLMGNVLRIVRIKERGLLVRTHGLGYEALRQNTKAFIEKHL
jgi:hypothetical protein